jgi:hypothetical protein
MPVVVAAQVIIWPNPKLGLASNHNSQLFAPVSNRWVAPVQTCVQNGVTVDISPVKKISFKQIKRQEAESRMAAIRRARCSPAAAAAEQKRASLVGDGAKWRITNFKQVARALAKWK